MIAGIAPGRVVEPASIADLADAMREASRAQEAIAFIGGGTVIDMGAAPARLDALVRTTRCAALVEYAPLDQVITVEAGMTLAELARITGEHAQRLALDPPLPERATVGGVIAANTFGPLRTRFGTIRDTIVGISIVRPDGTLVRGGGKVVKNVAGFDLPRLFVGSLGTLGAIATATLRLHPRPEAAHHLHVYALAASEVRAFVRRLRELHLEPAAMTAKANADGYDVALLFEGFAAGVEPEIARAGAAAAQLGHRAEGANDAAALNFAREHAAARTNGNIRIKLSAPPAAFESVHARALAPLCAVLAGARCVWYPIAGCGFIAGEAGEASAQIDALLMARSFMESVGGTLVLEAMPAALRAAIDVWGERPSAFSVMQRLKDRFDPHRVLAPGRFVGGL